MFPDAKILEIDLTTEKISKKILPGEIYRLYPGGSALGLYIILNEMDPKVHPLSPENIIVFSVSPLTGLPISGTSRMAVTTKSPLTGAIGDSQAGGFFPAHLKANGWDAVVIKGKAQTPVYLFIDGDNAEIRKADDIWGKQTAEAEKLIKEAIGQSDVEIAQIGPAGENMVLYASVINMCNRANGRNGTGAVMGSKNLKAFVVKKAKPRIAYDKQNLMVLTKNMKNRIRNNPAVEYISKHGTDGELIGTNNDGYLPTKNWTSGYFPEGAENITGTTMTDTILIGTDTCYGCAVRCKRVVEISGVVDPIYGGPEYETCAALGSYCGISKMETVALANQLCNAYGIDTISCGGTISFAMECYERGIITKEQTGGLELNFGNDEALLKLIGMIANREGIGDLLSEGSMRAAQKMGHEAVELSISVKGQELPAHMPQLKPSVGIIYAVNSFGADHQSSEHDPFLLMPSESKERNWLAQIGIWKGCDDSFQLDEEKVRYAFVTQCFFSILDTLCLCQFVWGCTWQLYGPSDLVDLCRYGIGWETSMYELMLIGERRINMMKYFNEKNGFSKSEDCLPERIFEVIPDGPSKGVILKRDEFYKAVDLYYLIAGWNPETGNPTEGSLRRLSLGWLLKDREYS